MKQNYKTQHLVDELSSIIIIPGKKLNKNKLVQDYLNPKPHLGNQFEKEIPKCKLMNKKKDDEKRDT